MDNQIYSMQLSPSLDRLIQRVKESISKSGSVAISQAWGILQLAVADTIQTIEDTYPLLKGSSKKEVALSMVSSFYDKVFLVVTIPYIPTFLQPIIQRYTKAILMLLVSSTIDSMVEIFRKSGVFVDPDSVDPKLDSVPKVSEK